MAELSEEQWALAGKLFERAAELPPEQLPSFLENECPDADVRQEVASLLEYSGGLSSAGAAIRALAGAAGLVQDPDRRLIGERLGPYRVEAIVGHGGMGAVYRAVRDDAEYQQQVAIKLVRAAAASPNTMLRFKRERQILARLAHPNIARLLDGGSTADGVPYLVMEFIEGEPITAWCQEHALSVEERLRLFLPLCDAVEFAHKRLVVHRDLKPANILVSEEGVPKLLDFGIAKLLDANEAGDAATQTGFEIMTPEYAAPEQVLGEPVSPAADVYGLGLILYEMLTGHQAQKMTGYSAGTIAETVCQRAPAAPASWNAQLAGDVDSIIRMAIRKEPDRRYRSTGELARDIERHLNGRPVHARPDTLAYRVGKFVRRNQGAVAAGAVVCASLAVGLALSLNARLGRMPRVTQVTQLTQIGSVEVGGPLATDGARIYFAERKGGSWWLAQVPVGGGAAQRLPLPEGQLLARPCILDISADRSSLLVGAGNGENEQSIYVVPTQGGAVRQVGTLLGHTGAWSRDGRHIVYAFGTALYQANSDGSNNHKLIDTPGSADLIHSAPAPGPEVLRFHVVDSKRMSALWEVAADGTGLHRLLPEWKPATGIHNERGGVWSSNGRYYFFESWHSKVRVRGIWARREDRGWLPFFHSAPVELYSTAMDVESLAVSPDGRRIFIGAGQERPELIRYDRQAGQFQPFLPGVAGRWVDCSPDGGRVTYVVHPAGTLWRSRADGSEAVQLTPQSMYVHQPRWSPDGARIAFFSAIGDQPAMVYVIPAAGGAPDAIADTSYAAGGASWSADGKSLVFGRTSYGGAPVQTAVYLVDLATRRSRRLPGSEALLQPAWSPDGRYVVAHRDRAQLLLFDFETGQWSLLAKGAGLVGMHWSHDGRYVYYQEEFGGQQQAISRVQLSTRRVERMMDLKRIPQSNVTAYYFGGLTPDDSPIVSVTRSNSDIYALDLELP